MCTERSTTQSHQQYPDQKRYDQKYYEFILPHVSGKVLDLGCGAGLFTKMIADKEEVQEVFALDKFPIEDRLSFRHQKITNEVLEFNPDTNFSFYPPLDCVVSTEFIEHISKEHFISLLPKIKSLLKPEGIFIGSTPIKRVPTTNKYHLHEYTMADLLETLKPFFKVTLHDIDLGCQVFICRPA